jgi:hypothetical protein
VSRSFWIYRCFALGEILVIFALFALQGAWPAPDVNEAHYLGKAAHYWNSDWVRGDFFLDSADSHKVFYFAFGWLTRFMPLPAVAWMGRIVTWLLMAWAWRRLSIAVMACKQPSPPAPLPKGEGRFYGWSILTAALFVMLNERFQMAGEWFIGGVEAKGFSYVLLLLGLEALVKNRWNRACLLFGAATAFHALAGGWAFVAAGGAWLLCGKKFSPLPKGEGNCQPKFTAILPGLVGGFLLSLPGMLPAWALSRNFGPEIIRQANVIYVFERLRHHLDIMQIKMEFLLRFAFLTLFYFLLCRLVKKFIEKLPIEPEKQIESRGILRLEAFVASALLIALLGISINLLDCIDRPMTAALLRFYWFRLADIALPLGTSFLAAFWIREKLRAKSYWGIFGLLAALGLAVYHFAGYVPERLNPGPARGDKNMIAASLATKIDAPVPSPAARRENLAAWQDACRWIAENAPADARFFTPRLSQTFKWYARRAEVATWKDVPQDAGALNAWWDRIQDVFATGSTLPEFRWRENATEMEPERLQKLAKKYEAEYLIAPARNPPDGWQEIYRNQGYTVCRLINP